MMKKENLVLRGVPTILQRDLKHEATRVLGLNRGMLTDLAG
jgi:hypothetical protein